MKLSHKSGVGIHTPVQLYLRERLAERSIQGTFGVIQGTFAII
jgi:hypothetical protein